MAHQERSEGPKYLDDFAVGDRIETGKLTISRDMIRAFAEVYDPQPMHLDEIAARETIFGGLVGSGWQTLAITMRLLVDARLLGSTPIIGAEFKETHFYSPVHPRDTLQVDAEVLAIRRSTSRQSRGFMDVRVTTRNGSGATVVSQTVVPTRSLSQV